MPSVGVATLEEDIRLGVQILVEGEKIDIQEFVRLASMFLQLLVPAMMTLVSLHEGYTHVRLAWNNFFRFRRPAVNLPFEWEPFSFSQTKGVLRVLPVLLFIFAGALIHGLVK